MSCLKWDDNGNQVCSHCGILLDESDDLSIDSGYCSEKCHLAGTELEDQEQFGQDDFAL